MKKLMSLVLALVLVLTAASVVWASPTAPTIVTTPPTTTTTTDSDGRFVHVVVPALCGGGRKYVSHDTLRHERTYRAVAAPGFRFVRWQIDCGCYDDIISGYIDTNVITILMTKYLPDAQRNSAPSGCDVGCCSVGVAGLALADVNLDFNSVVATPLSGGYFVYIGGLCPRSSAGHSVIPIFEPIPTGEDGIAVRPPTPPPPSPPTGIPGEGSALYMVVLTLVALGALTAVLRKKES